jgi:hypothetical protein
MSRYWDRPLGSKLILVLSATLLVEMLAPWQRVCQVTGSDDDPRICGWVTGYSGWGSWAAILAAAIFAWEILPIVWPRLSMRGWPAAIVTACLSVALAVVVLAKLIQDNEFQTAWAWIGLGLALAIMLTALVRVRYRWTTRRRERLAAEVEEAHTARPLPDA